jgi:ATP-dependent helicase/nuclease subunit A
MKPESGKGAKPPLPDQEARDTARFSLGENVVVEAGAGTGKTTLLTDRILFQVLAGGPAGEGLPVHRLVALTFTEKAAGEIQVRLSERLHDLVTRLRGGALPEKRARGADEVVRVLRERFRRPEAALRQAAESALDGLDRAGIGTIHRFAAQLLKLYPVEAGIDPAFDVDTGPVFDEVFESEWALWLDDELGASSRRAGPWLEVLPSVPLDDLADLARALCREGVEEAGFGAGEAARKRIADLARAVTALPDGKPAPGGNSKIVEAIERVGAHLRALSESFAAPPPADEARSRHDFKRDKAKKWPKAWAGLEGADLFQDGAALAAETSAWAEAAVRRAENLVRPFVERFRARYGRRGLVTFDGLLVKARRLVRDQADVRRDLKRRYGAVLIDEFQDTDPVQGELLLFLAEEAETFARKWEDVRFAPGRLFVVGDPKQSIYRFRGADIRAYQRFTESILHQGGRLCRLQTNFRSHAGLVSPVNAVFSTVMIAEDGLQPEYVPLHPRPGGTSSRSDSTPHVPASGGQESDPAGGEAALSLVLSASSGGDGDEGEPGAAESQRREARWIADWVRRRCVAAPPGAEPPEPPPGKFYRKHVAILFRSTTPLATFIEAFKEADIPYVVESDRYFYGAQEVVDLVNLLRVLDEPSDTIALLGLLRSPLAALEDGEVYRLRENGGFDYRSDPPAAAELPPDTRKRLAALFALLRRFRERVGREPLGTFLSALLQDSFLLEMCALAYHGQQTLSNLMKFQRLAAEAGDDRGVTLKEFIRTVDRSREESAQEGESPLADELLDAVRFLTIHKAKGLEYPVVFLPNLSGRPGGARDGAECLRHDWSTGSAGLRLPRAKAADAEMALIELEERRRESREWVRLLYVALTRARERLFLLGRADAAGRGSFAHFLRQAGAWPDADSRPAELTLADGSRLPVTYLPASPEEAARKTGPAGSARPLDLAAAAPAWVRRRADRDDWAARRPFRAPTDYLKEPEKRPHPWEPVREKAAPGALVGELCHRALETWDFDAAAGVAGSVSRAAAALRPRHPEADWASAEREAAAVLESFLAGPAARRLRKAEILGREVPFLMASDGAAVRGSVDLLYKEAGRLWVADYKTDRLTGPAAQRADRYARQGEAYRRAVESALGEPCGFRLIFLRTGEVVEVD